MIERTVSRRYAEALIMIAAENNSLAQMEKELAIVRDGILLSGTGLKELLEDPRVLPEEKKKNIKNAVRNQVGPIVANFLYLLVDKGREGLLPDILREFGAYADRLRNIVEAEVRSAVQITDKDFRELEQRLCKAAGKKVRLTRVIDTSLIGGLVVQMGDTVIDGSVVKRLALLKKHLQQSRFQGMRVIK